MAIDEWWESDRIKKESYCNVISDINNDVGINDGVASKSVLMSAIPLQLFPQPVIDFSIVKQVHSNRSAFSLQAHVNTVLFKKHGHYVHIYTDGSKNPENGKTSCAFYVPELKVKVYTRVTDTYQCMQLK